MTTASKRLTPADITALTMRVRTGDRVKGATYRLCTALQPSTVDEIIAHVWGENPRPGEATIEKVLDGYVDWRNAGRPGML